MIKLRNKNHKTFPFGSNQGSIKEVIKMKRITMEEIEKQMRENGNSTFADFVRTDLRRTIYKKWWEFLEEAQYRYIVVDHPNQGSADVFVVTICQRMEYMVYDYERSLDLKKSSDYLQHLTVEDAIVEGYDLKSSKSYEIYDIMELKKIYKTLKEAVEYVYQKQGDNNKVSIKKIEKELRCYWDN